MKSKLTGIAFILLLIVIGIGCGKKDEKQNNQPAVSSEQLNNLKIVDLNGQKVFLKYKFEKGEKLRYKLITVTSSQQTIKADSLMKSAGDQTLTYFFDIEVLEVDPDNIAELSLNISQIIYDGQMNGQKTHYDSKVNVSKEEKLKYAEFETVSNTPYRARVNQKGEILEVTRIDKMVDKMMTLQPEMQKMPADQKAALIKNISEGELKPRTQLLFRELTTSEVGKDSTWQKSTPASLGVFKLENIIHYRVIDFVKVGDDKAVKLSAVLSVKWSGEKKGTENGMNYLFDDPKVSGGGTILFNIDKGKVIRGETTTNLEMGVQVDGKDSMKKTKRTFRKDISMNKNIVELL